MNWTLPTAFLSGTAAAGGIALINSIGNLAGFAAPYAMGYLKDATRVQRRPRRHRAGRRSRGDVCAEALAAGLPDAVGERHVARLSVPCQATAEDREFLRFVPLQLFNRELRFGTLVGLLFALGTLLAIWTTVIWLPTIQSLMLEKEGIKGAAAAPIIGRNMMLWGIGGIFGYASFGFIADLIGRRPTVALYNVGTLVLGLTLFLAVDSMAPYPFLLVIYGFFVLGVFSGHAVYIPELFPTHVRATAVSFCNGTARVITSFGPLVAGLLAAPFGGNFNKPAAIMTCFALLSIYAMYLGRETRNDPLPL